MSIEPRPDEKHRLLRARADVGRQRHLLEVAAEALAVAEAKMYAPITTGWDEIIESNPEMESVVSVVRSEDIERVQGERQDRVYVAESDLERTTESYRLALYALDSMHPVQRTSAVEADRKARRLTKRLLEDARRRSYTR